MTGLFGAGGTRVAAPTPKPVRIPTITDPSVEAAGRRTRAEALKRKGRLSTILTDRTKQVTGSTGKTLGA